MSLVSEYTNLLIKQYWEKPKAKSEIQLKSETWETARAFLKSLDDAFDLDLAVGAQLDVLGRIVGIPREVPDVVENTYFGFDNNPDSLGFADKFNALRIGGPFFDRFSNQYTSLQLNDNDYRFFIRVKVALNWASAYVSSDDRISIQDVIISAFAGRAYVVDNLDMTLTLYVSPSVSLQRLRLIRRLNLLPKPQGVRYDIIVQAEPGITFGFASNLNSVGFADRFDSGREGGFLARKVI